ncbi:class I SAM-dependent methyltransferase [Rossellomorea sp. NPDC077527]|uniref:class I SAM-dependent methyltransferase n=1 Tax=Rossellomorea sp. NPDC077527 TaxID=3364510 RepID=UPI0037C5784B
MKKRIMELIDQQYKSPKGLLGVYFGEKMVLQHKIETMWTLELLDLKEQGHVLELGCGAGYAVKKALSDSPVQKVVGLDLSNTALISARYRNKSSVKKGCADFVQANVMNLPFDDHTYSKVFSIQSIYFWDSLSDTVSEIYRVLKEKGSIIITLSDGQDGKPWKGVQNMLTEELIPIMEGCGFKNIEMKKGPRSRGYHTVMVMGDKLM